MRMLLVMGFLRNASFYPFKSPAQQVLSSSNYRNETKEGLVRDSATCPKLGRWLIVEPRLKLRTLPLQSLSYFPLICVDDSEIMSLAERGSNIGRKGYRKKRRSFV